MSAIFQFSSPLRALLYPHLNKSLSCLSLSGLNEQFEHTLSGIDLDLVFDMYGNVQNRKYVTPSAPRLCVTEDCGSVSKRSTSFEGFPDSIGGRVDGVSDDFIVMADPHTHSICRDGGAGSEGGGSYVRFSDTGRRTTRYPGDISLLENGGRGQGRNKGSTEISGGPGDKVVARKRMMRTEKSIAALRDSLEKSASSKAIHAPATQMVLKAPAAVAVTPHQLYEYGRAIKAMRSIQEGIKSHKAWLYDADAGDAMIVSALTSPSPKYHTSTHRTVSYLHQTL